MKNRQIVALNTLPRSSSCRSTQDIIPSDYIRSSSFVPDPSDEFLHQSLVQRGGSPISFRRLNKTRYELSTVFRSFLSIMSFSAILPMCKCLNIPTQLPIMPSSGRKFTGTLFGHRRGKVSFAVQENPRSDPVSIIEFEVFTGTLVKEMSSGIVRIALECEKSAPSRGRPIKLVCEPSWTMYCNGRKCGYALSRTCTESDKHVLSTIQSVSVGAGVIPVLEDGKNDGASEGELLFMRAKFERIVGSRDSEAFYMINPDGNSGPELSIFLLRI